MATLYIPENITISPHKVAAWLSKLLRAKVTITIEDSEGICTIVCDYRHGKNRQPPNAAEALLARELPAKEQP